MIRLPGQNRFGDEEVFGVGDFQVVGRTADQRHIVADPFDQLGVVGCRAAIVLLIGLIQQPEAKNLRGQCDPKVAAIDRFAALAGRPDRV